MEHLIPAEWFEGLSQTVLLLIFAVSVAVLIKGADWLVDGASRLAYRLGLSKIVVGATIVSLGTTSPECAVSVLAAWQGESGLALGNGIGSIIADTGFIFGLGCVLTRLPADPFILRRQGWVQVGSAMLLAVVCYVLYARYGEQAVIARWVGLMFTGLLVVYMVASVRWAKQHPEGGALPDLHIAEGGALTTPEKKASILALLALMAVGLGLVIVSSHILVNSASELATQWGVPKIVIASTIVAMGTSLPELVVGLTAIIKGHKELLVGNIIGADILNVLFVIGFAAVAAPLPIIEDGSHVLLTLHLPVLMLIMILFRVWIAMATRRGSFSRWQGVPLLVIYVTYVVLGFRA